MVLPVSTKITLGDVTYEQPTGLFINNQFVAAKNGKTLATVNPATEKVITEVHAADKDDVDIAVAAARKAYKTVWKKTPGAERSKLLHKLADLMEEHRATLTAIEAADSGKPRNNNATYDVDECINVFNYYGGWADKIQGKTIMESDDKFAFTRHQPFGVCGQIIPWNYPLAMAAWKIGPAIATGNVIVLKTAEQTPLSMLYFGNLVVKAGFPPGVINIISGYGKDAGAPLASHMDVDKIAFTGSTATGKLIMQMAAASNLKAVTLECGGKSPMLVFDDADFEQAVKWAVFGIMYNQGQVCCATSRLYVQDTIYDKFVKAIKAEVEASTKMGDPFNDEVGHGPQVTDVQQKRVLSYIDAGKKEGATLVTGGEAGSSGNGFYIKPTVFADVKPEMTIVREEIFGPVVVVGKFSTEEEALELANDTIYGLGAAIFTQNITRAHKLANEIDAGTVWINSTNDSDIRIPFGGFKMSGIGSELGEYGLKTYTQVKSVQINLGSRL
ncbi:aldehyde dehydrogenase (NAD(+)) ALD2 [Sugiyamaella lignohabitans]|uniref:Aldehyde dehydrogenase (NAD(+)) ALD2 n=1 Tax=Sugiyamaella lignohabitans TaxID=796027 RepID=A0A161HKL6_9ASCO|nr:aldehyde dehydrogenase (NAD(+)) ALD2 [Sugiyamaella lignohabitans]ANB13587.1 aldehyde dehydrogenase (NAD(+)) ALD2 [Sugiyamaella lignohabitans]